MNQNHQNQYFSSSKRNIPIDYLRGVAAMSVLLFHYVKYQEIESSKFGLFFQHGYMGVDLFFIISGYVIFLTLSNSATPISFVISRLSRLFPTYIAAVITTSTFIFWAHKTGFTVDLVEPFTFLLNLTMLQSFFGVNDVDGAYWSLAYELVFYAVTGLAFFLIKKRNLLYSFFLVYVLLSVLYKIDRLGLPCEPFFKKYFIIDRISLFVAGISLYIMQNSKKWGFLLFIAAMISANVAILKPNYQISTRLIIENLFFLMMFIVTQFNFIIKFKSLHNFLDYIGSISYPLYLIHGEISWIVLVAIKPFDSILLNSLTSLLLVFTLSIILHKFVEIKVTRIFKSLMTKRFIHGEI